MNIKVYTVIKYKKLITLLNTISVVCMTQTVVSCKTAIIKNRNGIGSVLLE